MLFALSFLSTSSYFGIVGIFLAIASAIGFFTVYARASFTKSTIEALNLDNTALRGRISTLETEKSEMVSKMDALDTRIQALEGQNRMLSDIVTGASALQRLTEVMDNNHLETLELLERIINK